MIVFHSFFYKKHPKYLERAVGMLRGMNNRGLVHHGDLDVFAGELRKALAEDSGGRYESHDVSLVVSKNADGSGGGQLQIEVKGGLDYAARISYIVVEKSYYYELPAKKKMLAWRFLPAGGLKRSETERKEM